MLPSDYRPAYTVLTTRTRQDSVDSVDCVDSVDSVDSVFHCFLYRDDIYIYFFFSSVGDINRNNPAGMYWDNVERSIGSSLTNPRCLRLKDVVSVDGKTESPPAVLGIKGLHPSGKNIAIFVVSRDVIYSYPKSTFSPTEKWTCSSMPKVTRFLHQKGCLLNKNRRPEERRFEGSNGANLSRRHSVIPREPLLNWTIMAI